MMDEPAGPSSSQQDSKRPPKTSSTSSSSSSFKEKKTYRFEVILDPKSKEYEVNWLDLIATEEEKKNASRLKMDGASRTMSGALDPYASDDEDQLRALARKYEQKYGNSTTVDKIKKKKKARKLDDYADLGYGYDSNDPFIDNSEIHDEIVPENITTAYGGFYVNCGPLEFRARESADEDSDVEAVIQEGEKAAKKRKYLKKNGDAGGSSTDDSKKMRSSDDANPVSYQ